MSRLLLLLPLLAACAGPLAPPSPQEAARQAAVPPPAAVDAGGAGDPMRAAIAVAAVAFTGPAPYRGDPAGAARALAIAEYLAAEVPRDPRSQVKSPLVAIQWRQARAEWRAALGIAGGVPPAVASVALAAAGQALQAGDQPGAARALAPLDSPGIAGRLAALPPLPAANRAAALTHVEYERQGDPGED